MASHYAELEIALHRRDSQSYVVEIRFTQPDSDAEVRPSDSVAQFDFSALRGYEYNATSYGGLLTESLFKTEESRRAFNTARAIATTLKVPLQLRLIIGPTATELHALRWELLRDPIDNSPLCTNQNIFFSRNLNGRDWSPITLRSFEALHALIVVANPTDLGKYRLAPVDVVGELKRAREGLGKIPATTIPGTEYRHATLNNLSEHLRNNVYDILYLVAHGALVDEIPYLWLEDDNQSTKHVSGDALVERLQELQPHKRPLLVILASCQSMGNDASYALAALGPRLAEAGIPAVIAMQGNITMETVKQLMPTFFAELQRDGQIDRALTVARGVVRERVDFWMPVLFTRLINGCLWSEPAEKRKGIVSSNLGVHPNNLPAQVTPFISREREIREVSHKLLNSEVRLLTLTGPGGTGKTRLALRVASDVLVKFSDGVFFIPLAPVNDHLLVLATIAQNLGVMDSSGQSLQNALRDYLQQKHILLILDNFEQVLKAAKEAAELLSCSPYLKIMVTSRETMHIYGEHVYMVPPLDLPSSLDKELTSAQLSQYGAVRLFIDRAQMANPTFVMDDDNAPAVVEICYRLDGLPLAIELAAARVRLLPPQAMLTLLERRLRLLVGGARDLPLKQQTLRGAIEWSYELLDEAEQILFRRLSIFAGGCSINAVQAVCLDDFDSSTVQAPEVIDLLEALVNKSLIRQEEKLAGEPSIVMLETIREYAWEQVMINEEATFLHRQHSQYYIQLAEDSQGEDQIRGPRQKMILDSLERANDNFRVVFKWTLEGADLEAGAKLACALWRFWWMRNKLTEGRRWLLAFLEQREHLPIEYVAKLLNSAGILAREQGDYLQATSLHEEAKRLFEALHNQRGMVSAISSLGVIAREQGHYSQAEALLQQALRIGQQLGNSLSVASSFNQLGILAKLQEDYERAESLLEQSLHIRKDRKDHWGIAICLNNLGEIAICQKDFSRAHDFLEEGLSVIRGLDDYWGVAMIIKNLGKVALLEGDLRSAEGLFKESLVSQWELGAKNLIAESIEGLASVALLQGNFKRVTRLLGAAESIRSRAHLTLSPLDQAEIGRKFGSARGALDHNEFDALYSEGQKWTIDHAVEFALERPLRSQR